MLDEGPLMRYLDSVKESDDKQVVDYAFSTLDLHSSLLLGNKYGADTLLMGAS